MTPADLEAFEKECRDRFGWTSHRQIVKALDISLDRYYRLKSGAVSIPRHIALACNAITMGIPPYPEPGAGK